MEGRAFKDAVFAQFAAAAAAFAAPKRVELIDVLAQGERRVESLAEATAMSVGNTSRHLQILRNAGMVASRRDGVHIYYRIADQSVVDSYRQLQGLAESRLAEVRRLTEAFFDEVDGAQPVGIAELLSRLEREDVVLVDVRPPLEFEAGHLPGAISMPLQDLADRMAELDPESEVVAYCRGPYCVMAAQAVARLRDHGVRATRAQLGPLEWQAQGLPLQVGT